RVPQGFAKRNTYLGASRVPRRQLLRYLAEDSVICVHPNSPLLLEPVAFAGIALVPGGVAVAELIGWTFVPGTSKSRTSRIHNPFTAGL
ncbi:hypothetical protein KAR02_10425, partial [Candidatus Bipolaricaulota bacterium]|nr:hypothetical protein [Candidatus Bipolaricaulota bacterium]